MTSLKVISGCVLIAFLAVGQCSALRVEREERRKISVAADTRGRESRAAALPCRAARRETAHTGNAFVPVCTKAGNYRRPGQCWCVDPVTGTEIRGTRQRLGMITCHKNAPLSKHGWLMEKRMFNKKGNHSRT
ncbi:hypothetical protein LSAT2_014687 [Lamellibrachia satsuma]|nr:hypothetical protein LSAT2_014687 [Lamellibrachia satsuma]